MARLPGTAGALVCARTAPLCALALALAAMLLAPSAAGAAPAWPTYHHDAARSGVDPDGGEAIAPFLDWHSPDLGAPIWGQPLMLGDRVYVATVGDRLDALDAASGAIVWSHSLGTPVPAKELECGDVLPTVGIVGTPVIDTSTGVIYAVADNWDETTQEAHHELVGLALAGGEQVLRTNVDPPGADPKTLLQRTALNLDGGDVVFGFGGNDGDCGVYRGAVVAAPESGAPASFWQVPIEKPAIGGGAVWATPGPAVDGEGHIFASTGNPNPDNTATVYDKSDSVIELAAPPSPLSAIGAFATPKWKEESRGDLDLSSAGPEPLPGGLVFQAGKTGVGYLIEPASMIEALGMGTHAKAVFNGEVCGGQGSFGGDSYAAGVIYIPCTNGVQALAYDQVARTFTPIWKGPADAFGPPILAAGLVWSPATGGFSGGGTKLYGLDPASGAVRYTETLPTPIADHFASPSAAGGRLFLSTGSSVTAFRIAAPAEPAGAAPNLPETPPQPTNTTTTSPPTTTATVSVKPATPTAVLLGRSLHAGRGGQLRLRLRCRPAGTLCRGTLTLRAIFTVGDARQGTVSGRTVTITLARTRYGPARADFVVTLHLGADARAHLRRHPGGVSLHVALSGDGAHARVFSATIS